MLQKATGDGTLGDESPDGRRPPRYEGSSRAPIRAPHRFFLQLTRDYGDIVQYRAAPEAAYLVNHPRYVKQLLVTNARNYNKDTFLNKRLLQAVTGQGLLTSENPLWRQQRRLIQPAFHRRELAKFAGLMCRAAEQMLDRWQGYATAKEAFDVNEEMMKLSLRVVTEALFGYDIREEAAVVGNAVSIMIEIAKPKHRRVKEQIGLVDEVVYAIIEKRRDRPDDSRHDLLHMLLQARYEETGEPMSDQQVRDEVISLLIAGHETTANTLSWMWYLLAQHPEVVERLAGEISEVLGGRPPAIEDFGALPTCDRVIKESMRLYPSAWSISRRALGDDRFDDYHVPAGSIVALSPYALHRHPDYWPEPERFDPDRFSPELEAGRNRFVYLPFGSGARKCIGDQFALMECIVFLPMVLQRFQLALVPGQEVEAHALVTLRPKNGVWVTAATV